MCESGVDSGSDIVVLCNYAPAISLVLCLSTPLETITYEKGWKSLFC